MKPFFHFLAGNTGRAIRAVAGIALILVGLLVVKDVAGFVLAAVGLVPLAAGLFDFCVFSPIFKLGFRGADVREKTRS